MAKQVRPTVFGGTMIIAGTSIGAGMLALPTVSAGMWLFWSLFLLLVTWGLLYLSSRALLEVNLHHEPGDSFDTMVKTHLGFGWNLINGISIAFVLYILLYAYISGGSSTVKDFASSFLNVEISYYVASLLFSALWIGVVFIGTSAVDRVSSILMMGMVITFVATISGMSSTVNIHNLLHPSEVREGNKIIYVWAAVSTYFTSFAFHNAIPSLVKYFGKDPIRISQSIYNGTIIAFLCYLAWIVVAQGNVSRESFRIVIAEGGNVGALLKMINSTGGNVASWLGSILNIFAFFALTTSFLGVGLGLFDYITDLFKLSDSLIDKIKATAITFVPPMIGGIFFPNGFIQAIAWAGLFCVVWAIIIPAMMLIKTRQKYSTTIFKAYDNVNISYVLIGYGVFCGICHILVVLNILPTFM